jgi:general secretion pathway protein A
VTTGGQPGRLEGYESFFGLNETPFSLAPDPRFLFASASHSAALAQVAYAIERREPLVVITGEIGTGKTLLCRTVLQRLQRQTFLSVITDPLLERDDLLKQLLQDFGVISKDRTKLAATSRHELVRTLQAFLGSLTPIQAHAVVIVDEAQHLQPDVLEQIRLLSSIGDARGTLLQIILVGQTDLAPLLARPELRQLQQRVSRRFLLEALNRDEVEQYIQHRLALARDGKTSSQMPGATELTEELAAWAGPKQGVEFTPAAVHVVSELSGGVPRVINLLCDRSLEGAYASRLRVVDGPLIHAAAAALGLRRKEVPAAPAHPATTTRVIESRSDESVKGVARHEPSAPSATVAQPVDKADVRLAPPARLAAQGRAAASSRLPRYAALAVSAALVIVAIAFGLRTTRPPDPEAPSSAAAPSGAPAPGAAATSAPAKSAPVTSPPATSPPVPAPSTSAPGRSNTLVPNSPAAAGAATPAPGALADAPTGSPTGGTGGVGRFEIVVASFRTDARATSVAAEVAALGLPIGRRVADGWQQVICGPFTSRPDAEQAQQRIHLAGLTGTLIVPLTR